jgi:hypothetical protein
LQTQLVTAFRLKIYTSLVALGFGTLDKVCCFRKLLASGFFSWQFLKSYQRSKVFLFLLAVFGGQCGGFLFSVRAPSSYLSFMSLLFLQVVFGGQCGCILLQNVFSDWTQLILFCSGSFYECQLPSTYYSSSNIFIQTSFKLIASR